jgi:hypothetical protein
MSIFGGRSGGGLGSNIASMFSTWQENRTARTQVRAEHNYNNIADSEVAKTGWQSNEGFFTMFGQGLGGFLGGGNTKGVSAVGGFLGTDRPFVNPVTRPFQAIKQYKGIIIIVVVVLIFKKPIFRLLGFK